MTIDDIKKLTKFLNDEDIEEIKKQIKSKEKILKEGKLEEEEMNKVLNTLFSILVLEKSLESEIEDIDELRKEIEEELMEAYQIYDSYMAKCKAEDKKKKKKWLLDFLRMSERIHSKKDALLASKKEIERLKKELDDARSQRRDERLRNVCNNEREREKFCKYPRQCKNPYHHHQQELNERLGYRRIEKLTENVRNGQNTRINEERIREGLLRFEESVTIKMVYDPGISARKPR